MYWYFSYFPMKTHRGFSSEAPCQGASNENPQHYLFVLRFYGPVNPMGSCRARSVYLTTRLLGRTHNIKLSWRNKKNIYLDTLLSEFSLFIIWFCNIQDSSRWKSKPLISKLESTCIGTNNPLYTDTRYNDKIHYNDNLPVTKPLLKRLQLVTNYARILYLIL